MRKLGYAIVLNFIAVAFGIQYTAANGLCPDLVCTSYRITSVTSILNYEYTIKNVGTDTIFFNRVTMQNYTAYDSSINSTVIKPAGGAVLSYLSQKYLLPDSSITGTYSAYPSVSVDSLSYLITEFYFHTGTECTLDRNIAIRKIRVSTGFDALQAMEEKIIWNSALKQLQVNLPNVHGKYSIYNIIGMKLSEGLINGNDALSISTNPGIYIVEVILNNQRVTKRIVVE